MQKSIIDVLLQGDAISHTIAILLVILSTVTWVIFIYKYLALHYISKNIPKAVQSFWEQENLSNGIEVITKEDAYYSGVVANSLVLAQKSSGQQANLPLNQVVGKYLRVNLQALHNKIHTGHNFLATVGSTSPFVGLFGTVWGIYHALISIAGQGQVSIDKIAGPVGEALIMTAFGLVVALPAVVAYNVLSKKAKFVYQYLDGFAKDIHNIAKS
jgi:biopolymer transport protein ExbB